jgi:hypothetical protein
MHKKWNLDACKINALKYKTRTEWQKKSSGAYDSAYSNGWLNECTQHMVELLKPKGYWSLERCIEDAKKYTHIAEWRINSSSGYSTTKRNKWLKECCGHMIPIGSLFKRMIYCFEFPDNSVYVGLTYNSKQRKNQHLNQYKITPVNSYIMKTGLIPLFKELTDYINVKDAKIKEGEFVSFYKNNGWNILNVASTGSIGRSVLYWTKEKCCENSLLYKTRTEWAKKSAGAYRAAYKNGWLDDCCQHMQNMTHNGLNKKWLKDDCINEAKKYTNKKDWGKCSPASISSAYKMGWMKDCDEHMISKQKPYGFWTKERVIENSMNFSSKVEWREKSSRLIL